MTILNNNQIGNYYHQNPAKLTNSILREALTSQISKAKSRSTLNLKQKLFANQLIAASKDKLKLTYLLNQQLFATSATKETAEAANIPFKNHKLLNLKWSPPTTQTTTAETGTEQPSHLISSDSKTVCFHPYCAGCFETNAVRATQPLRRNAYTYWEISLKESTCQGTSVMIGVGTAQASLNSIGYLNLIGIDKCSWGLSNKGQLWHDNVCTSFCSEDEIFATPDCRIGCLFDGYTGRITYFKNGKLLNPQQACAFADLPVKRCDLYPMVSSTVAKSVLRLECAYESFPTLKDLCRNKLTSIPYSFLN